MLDEITYSLLEIMSEDKEDFTLFMNLQSKFDQFRHNKISEFEKQVFLPDLKSVLAGDKEHNYEILNLENVGKWFLFKWNGVSLVSPRWPKGLFVSMQSDNDKAQQLHLQTGCDLPNTDNSKLSETHKIFTKLMNEYEFQNIINEACFPLISRKIDKNDDYVWLFLQGYSSLWDNPEALFDIIADINLKKQDNTKLGVVSQYFIEILLTLANCLDQTLIQYKFI
jgi:hypothetical protein